MTVTLASGILFLTDDKQALFLKRGNGSDHPGEWCFPGGHVEDGETVEECAIRETKEELGEIPEGGRKLWTRQISNSAAVTPMPAAEQAATAPSTAPPLEGAVATDPSKQVDYTTFLQTVKEQFVPKVNGEHTGYAWASVTTPPEPLHPGARIALDRLNMDELGIARAMAAGQLTSPQVYENVTLHAIRITGTGAAYRRSWDEFVWRDPALYLNEEFVARCNGLPVIFEHPKKATLDSKEFSDRIVGTTFLPFIGDGVHFPADEVWGIAKIYDAEANEILSGKDHVSTSPSVVFRDPSVNNSVELEDGQKLLIEGKPSLLDHIAICKQGVWDKGGDPLGVKRSDSDQRKDNVMTEEEKAALAKKDAEEKENRAKADAANGDKLDKLLTGIDSLSKRMDAIEEKAADKRKDGEMPENLKKDAKKDGEEEKHEDDDDDSEEEEAKAKEVAADKKRKDGEMPENLKKADKKRGDDDDDDDDDSKRKDSRADADIASIRKEVNDLKSKIVPRSDEDHRAMAEVQSRADDIFQAFGGHAKRPMDGESLLSYRRRLATQLKVHSPDWKSVDLAAVADSAGFDVIERRIYADALKAAESPSLVEGGKMREIVRSDSAGRRISTFVGKDSFVRQFTSRRGKVVDFASPSHELSRAKR